MRDLDLREIVFTEAKKLESEEHLPELADNKSDTYDAFPNSLLNPPGLMGEVFEDIRTYSQRDQPTIALAGAIVGLSAFSSNHYLVMPYKTPLSPYVIGVAPTGSGKESVRKWNTDMSYKLGRFDHLSTGMASGPALLRTLCNEPTQTLILDEFGKLLQLSQTTSAGHHGATLINEIMSLYGLGDSFYAGKRYSDTNNNVGRIDHPFLSLIGITTGSELMKALKESDVTSGFLNRCILIESLENLPARKIPSENVSAELVFKLRRLINETNSEVVEVNSRRFIPITLEQEAHKLFKEWESELDEYSCQPYGPIWARAGQNALILAGLLTLGGNLTITKDHLLWGVGIVEHSCKRWIRKLEGEMASSPFHALTQSALDYIKRAKDYRGDKAFAYYLSRGYMPHGKLTKLLKVDRSQCQRVVDYLLDTRQIKLTKDQSHVKDTTLYIL